MARSATFRRIARDVEEIAFFMALRTDIGRRCRCDGVATFVALPVRQATIWTNIPHKFTRLCVATQGTLHFSFSLFHLIYLHSFPSSLDAPCCILRLCLNDNLVLSFRNIYSGYPLFPKRFVKSRFSPESLQEIFHFPPQGSEFSQWSPRYQLHMIHFLFALHVPSSRSLCRLLIATGVPPSL